MVRPLGDGFALTIEDIEHITYDAPQMMGNQSRNKVPIKGWQICSGRNAVGLSRPELAHLAGVSASTIERAERGGVQVGPEKLSAIRKALEAKELVFTTLTIKFAKGR